MNEASPAAATSCGKSSQCLWGNWQAQKATYQFSHISQLQRKGLGQSTTFTLWCISTTSFQLHIRKQTFRLRGREDAPDQAASSEQLTRFPPSPLLAWSISEERNLLTGRHINQESFSCWKLQQCHPTDLQGKKRKKVQLIEQGGI